MATLRLLLLAVKLHWNAHKSNPANLFAGVIGMIVNNLIVMWGLWAMLFDGKPEGDKLTIYFLCLNSILATSWGSICYFLGGIRRLGDYIEEGSLEPMLSTTRDPLLLVAIAQSSIPSLGDIFQGILNLFVIFYLSDFALTFRCMAFTFVSASAVLAMFIFFGSLPFFVRRGSTLGQLLIETNLSLSFYPTGKIFTDSSRFFLYLTPAAFIGVLPMEAIESGHWGWGLLAMIGSAVFFLLSVRFFRIGLKRYQTSSYIVARS